MDVLISLGMVYAVGAVITFFVIAIRGGYNNDDLPTIGFEAYFGALGWPFVLLLIFLSSTGRKLKELRNGEK